jgi:hypothetical protein
MALSIDREDVLLVVFCEEREVEMVDSEGIEADTIGRLVPDVVGA